MTEPSKPPLYIDMAMVAQLLGWQTQRARRWMRRAGVATKVNGRWVTTRHQLREHFPEVYDSLWRES